MKKDYDLKSLRKRPGPVKVYPAATKVALSIRLDASVLSALEQEAARLAFPCQTLINSILHRFVTGQLVDKPKKKPNR